MPDVCPWATMSSGVSLGCFDNSKTFAAIFQLLAAARKLQTRSALTACLTYSKIIYLWLSTAISEKVYPEFSVLLGCGAASLGGRCLMFRNAVVVSHSRIKLFM